MSAQGNMTAQRITNRDAVGVTARRTLVRVAIVATLATFSTLPGCTAPKSYFGVPLQPGAADPDLQRIAASAQHGNKDAQLELGIRYEEGVGVPVDYKLARDLYAAAASTVGQRLAYSPAVGNSPAKIISLPNEQGQRGSEEALQRKNRIEILMIQKLSPADYLSEDRNSSKADKIKRMPELHESIYDIEKKFVAIYDGSSAEELATGEAIACDSVLASAFGPNAQLAALCSRYSMVNRYEIRPNTLDTSKSYYLRCRLNLSLAREEFENVDEQLRHNRKNASVATDKIGNAPEPSMDATWIELRRGDRILQIEFLGARECMTRLVVIDGRG